MRCSHLWELTKLPYDKKTLHSKYYMIRLVVKGFQQKEGFEYNEILYDSEDNNYQSCPKNSGNEGSRIDGYDDNFLIWRLRKKYCS